MNLPRFALAHKPIVIGLALLTLLWGLNTFLTAPRREDPQFIIRDAIVITQWPGATAKQVEALITDKVEKSAANIKKIRKVQSHSYPGRSVVQVTAVDEVTDVQQVWTKLRVEMKLLAGVLPAGASEPVVDDNFGDTASLILALYQDERSAERRRYSPRELEVFAKRLRDHLMDLRPSVERADGRVVPITTEPAFVARLSMFGVQEEAIYLEVDAGQWSHLEIDSDRLAELLEERNLVAPAGIFSTDTYRIGSHLSSSFTTTREIDSLVVDRVTDGVDGDNRMTIGELVRQLPAGLLPGSPRPVSQEIPVHLNDIDVRVVRGFADPPTSLVRYGDAESSHDAIILSFTMKPGQNITLLGDAVDRLLASATQTFLPADIEVVKVSNPPLYVEQKVNSVLSNLVQAIALVLLILGALAGLRVAAVTAASIPLIMLTSLALMRIWNVEIEQISLAALIVALGLLVDNAIVTCENTTRFLNEGMPRREAVVEGCQQVGSSLLWSSLTTIGVFIPMAFALPGDLGEFVFSLPVVVTLTLLVSWLCAMTVTPILNYYLLTPTQGSLPIVAALMWLLRPFGIGRSDESKSTPAPSEAAPRGGFYRLCRIAITLRIPVIGGAFALLAASLMLPVPPSFFPTSDRNQFVVDVWLPETASIARTDEITQQVESMVRRLDTVTWRNNEWVTLEDDEGNPITRLDNMAVYVGTGGPRFYTGLNPESDAPNYAIVTINASSQEHVASFVADIRRASWAGIGAPRQADFVEPIAGARIVPHQLVMGTPVPSPIQYRLTGPRLASENVLRRYGERLKNILKDSGYVWDVHDSWGAMGLQLNVNVDTDAANLAGVTNLTVADTLNTYYSGMYLTTFREGDRQIPVKLRLPKEQRTSLSSLHSARVEGLTGKVPLDSVSEFAVHRVPVHLTRYQRERSLWIQARPEPGLLARDILAELRPQVDAIEAQLPPGYRIEDGGIEEEAARGERSNSVALGIGLILVLFCLILQYNSWVKPMLIVLTVPLSIIGGMLGLYLRDIPIGFMETLGFLALFGTVLNAAILMIDFVEQLIREKHAESGARAPAGERSYCGLTQKAFRDCLATAAQTRMMPIFMTTATTVAGLMSLMFGGGPLFMGLATVFATGLVVGSAITLIVLPALIALFVENFRYQLVVVESGAAVEADEGAADQPPATQMV